MSDSGPPQAAHRFSGALLTVGLLILCAAGGVLMYRLSRPAPPTLYAEPPGALQPAPPPPAGAVPASAAAAPKIPEQLPELTLPTPQGTPTPLSAFRGSLLVLNFWATWCEPCRREIPLLLRLRGEYAKDGVEIVGIALDHRDDVIKYAAEHHLTYPLLDGEKHGLELVEALGMDTVLPFSVFADRSGRIVTLKIGELQPREAALILGRLVDLDQKRLTIAAARGQIAAGMARLHGAPALPDPPSPN